MTDKYEKFRNFKNKSEEECAELIEEAPQLCPILNIKKSTANWFNEVVYGKQPALQAFSIPKWDKKLQSFRYYCIHDMDGYIIKDCILINLKYLLDNGWTIEELEKLYDIKIKEEE